jgi:predicted MFS family arabinose efflux permease
MTASVASGSQVQGRGKAYAGYVLGVLMMVYVLNFVDRQVLSILMEPIRRDLKLNDTQLGLLSGLSFALFYAVAGLPIARLSDTSSRRNIIAASLAVWSGMTAVCGLVASFPQLLLARVGVAVGEAGAGPAAHSMIADLFPDGRRATALAVFSTGVPIGILVGLISGGWLNQAFNWRTAFVVVGLPGLVLAVLVMLTVREPARTTPLADPSARTTGAALKNLWALRPFKYLTLAAAIHAFTAYGALQWNPAFLIRTFHLSTKEAGLALGLMTGLTGIVGTLGGGWLADRLGRRDPRWYARLPALLIALGVPFYIAAYVVAPSAGAALALLVIPSLFGNSFTGPTYAVVQTLTPPRSRALASAVLLFVISLIGFGLGPLTIGMVSDALAPSLGGAALGRAISINAIGDVASVVLFLIAAKDLDREFGRPVARSKQDKVTRGNS